MTGKGLEGLHRAQQPAGQLPTIRGTGVNVGHVPVQNGLPDERVSLQGDAFSVGSCRAACKACKPCSKSDLGCQAENRLNAGFLPMHLDDWE